MVQIRQKTWLERTLVRLLGGALLAAFAWTAYTQYFGGGSLLQEYYIRHAKEHLGKIALLEEAHRSRYGYYTNDLLRLSLLSGDPVQFQRDTQKILQPRGFKIGVKGDSYKISAVAKDAKKRLCIILPGSKESVLVCNAGPYQVRRFYVIFPFSAVSCRRRPVHIPENLAARSRVRSAVLSRS